MVFGKQTCLLMQMRILLFITILLWPTTFFKDYGQRDTLTMHKHHWECTDIPGIFMCHADGQTGYFNSLTREITEDVD